MNAITQMKFLPQDLQINLSSPLRLERQETW